MAILLAVLSDLGEMLLDGLACQNTIDLASNVDDQEQRDALPDAGVIGEGFVISRSCSRERFWAGKVSISMLGKMLLVGLARQSAAELAFDVVPGQQDALLDADVVYGGFEIAAKCWQGRFDADEMVEKISWGVEYIRGAGAKDRNGLNPFSIRHHCRTAHS
jgi:hypothetical protein